MALPALIFDLDGTLVDTAPDLLAAMNSMLAARAAGPWITPICAIWSATARAP